MQAAVSRHSSNNRDVFVNGAVHAIIGLSGCGKTTLLRRLCGVRRGSGAGVWILGMPVERLLEEYPLAIGYLAQGECLAPGLSAHETLWTAARLRLPRSVDLDVVGQWIAHLLRISRMEPLLEQRVETLSGGEKRRLALAEALVSDPSVLFLDELTSGLDAYSDREMMRFLRELAHEHGKTVLLVTHSTLHAEFADVSGAEDNTNLHDSRVEAPFLVHKLNQKGRGLAPFGRLSFRAQWGNLKPTRGIAWLQTRHYQSGNIQRTETQKHQRKSLQMKTKLLQLSLLAAFLLVAALFSTPGQARIMQAIHGEDWTNANAAHVFGGEACEDDDPDDPGPPDE